MFTFDFLNTEQVDETKNNDTNNFHNKSNDPRIQNTTQILSRRSDKDVLKLVHSFQSVIENSAELTQRVTYFWSTHDALDSVLLRIATEIPSLHNPLWAYDANEDFDDSNSKIQQLNVLEDNMTPTSSNIALKQPIKKRPMISTKPKCVEWLGLTNDQTNFAAIQLLIPGTQEQWFTWTNRLIVFLFAHIPSYSTPEDFIRVLNPPIKGPLKMHCKNSKCVRLSHIHYLPDNLKMYEGIGCNTHVTSLKKESKVKRSKKHSDQIKKKNQRMPHVENTQTATSGFDTRENNKLSNVLHNSQKDSSSSTDSVEKDAIDAQEPNKMLHTAQSNENVTQDIWSPGF